MKKYAVLLSAFLVLFGFSGYAIATSIIYSTNTDAGGNNYVSPYAGVTTETFEGGTIGSLTGLTWNWTGNGAVATGTGDTYSAPLGATVKDTTKYVTVPQNVISQPQSVTVTNLGNTYNYFGIWWGSIDTYNTLSFYKNGVQVASFGGLDIVNPADGSQTSHATNLYVNFLGLPDFNSFTMTSTQFAFEADNIAVGNVPVPEPTTMLLLGLGLIGLAGVRRKFQN